MEKTFEWSEDGKVLLKLLDKEATEIVVPEGVEKIGNEAFKKCSSLQSISLPNSLTTIGEKAFCKCISLTELHIPDSVISIGDYAFWKCTGIVHVNVPRSVNTIGRGVFKDCESLVSIHIPDNVKSIGDLAFWHCKSLASIEIPESVTSIGMNAFSYGRLESVYIPASITAMGEAPFSTCWALKNINVASDNPHYVSIDGVLFSKDMERIIAFPAGKKVEEYRIPSSVLSIERGAFSGCSPYENWHMYFTKVHIPDGVASIGAYAFGWCRFLQSIDIPASVTSIGMSAFESCECLQTVYFRHQDIRECEIDAEAFKRVDLNKCTLCVTEENLEACRQHPVLSKFKHILTSFSSDDNG